MELRRQGYTYTHTFAAAVADLAADEDFGHLPRTEIAHFVRLHGAWESWDGFIPASASWLKNEQAPCKKFKVALEPIHDIRSFRFQWEEFADFYNLKRLLEHHYGRACEHCHQARATIDVRSGRSNGKMGTIYRRGAGWRIQLDLPRGADGKRQRYSEDVFGQLGAAERRRGQLIASLKLAPEGDEKPTLCEGCFREWTIDLPQIVKKLSRAAKEAA